MITEHDIHRLTPFEIKQMLDSNIIQTSITIKYNEYFKRHGIGGDIKYE
jgi:hypothetical protein